MENRGNKHWFFNPSEFSLSDLMQQKYIAMYLQPEQWTDMRRYHYSNKRNNYGIGDANEIVYPELRRPYNLYAAYWIDGLTEAQKENTWIQRLNYDPGEVQQGRAAATGSLQELQVAARAHDMGAQGWRDYVAHR